MWKGRSLCTSETSEKRYCERGGARGCRLKHKIGNSSIEFVICCKVAFQSKMMIFHMRLNCILIFKRKLRHICC
jgi:hypothetical protein